MATFDTLSSLFEHIKTQVYDVLGNEVAEDASKKMVAHAQKDVLDVYEPSEYQRSPFDGIASPSNVKCDVSGGNTLEVKNVTQPEAARLTDTSNHSEETRLARWIVEGIYNPWGTPGGVWSRPRPFVENAAKEIINTKSHIVSMKAGLKLRGIDVE